MDLQSSASVYGRSQRFARERSTVPSHIVGAEAMRAINAVSPSPISGPPKIRSTADLALAWPRSLPRSICRVSDRHSTRRLRPGDAFNSSHPLPPKNCLRRFTNGWPPRHQGCSCEAQRGGRRVHLTIRSGGAGPMGICNAPSSNMEGGLQLTHFIE